MARASSSASRVLESGGAREAPAARVWRTEARTFADRVDADVSGNSAAILNPDAAPRIMLAGHIDEIGVMVVVSPAAT